MERPLALAGLLGLEHEEFHRKIGVLVGRAHERLDLVPRQLFDRLDEPFLHRVLPVVPGLAHLVPPAGLEQRLLARRVAAAQNYDDELGLQIGPAAGRPLSRAAASNPAVSIAWSL